MDEKSFDPYFLSDNAEKEMWQNCIFVFDTSALLNFYEYSITTTTNLFKTVFSKVQGRLWIPHHVEYEYLKNRETSIKKPIEKKYKPLLSDNLAKIKSALKDIKNTLKDFQNRAKITTENTHPYINEDIPNSFEGKCKEFEQAIEEFENQVEQEIDTRVKEIESTVQNDILLNAIKKFFDVGEGYSFSEIMAIIAEGEIRYRNEVPPGYKDFDDKKKKGIQKYGDLIIWKQILDYAKSVKKPIVLITDDLKEDWCLSTKNNEKRIDMPREDLIREFQDTISVRFWMYTLKQFLYKAKVLLHTTTKPEVFEEIDKVEQEQINLSYHFNDALIGMNEQLKALANFGALSETKRMDEQLKKFVIPDVFRQFEKVGEQLREFANPKYLQEFKKQYEQLKKFANPIDYDKLNPL